MRSVKTETERGRLHLQPAFPVAVTSQVCLWSVIKGVLSFYLHLSVSYFYDPLLGFLEQITPLNALLFSISSFAIPSLRLSIPYRSLVLSLVYRLAYPISLYSVTFSLFLGLCNTQHSPSVYSFKGVFLLTAWSICAPITSLPSPNCLLLCYWNSRVWHGA